MRHKRRIPWCGGGGGYKMATQAILLPPQWRMDHLWQSQCKIAIYLPIPQRRIFARNFFNKIDAEASYLGYTGVKIYLPLSCELWNQICGLYSKLALYKLGGRGKLLKSESLHSRGNISVGSRDQEQEQSRPLQHTVDSRPFVIFPPKILLHIVCIFNIFTKDWGCNSRLTKEAISSVMFFMLNI
jgi:hypothetical protein